MMEEIETSRAEYSDSISNLRKTQDMFYQRCRSEGVIKIKNDGRYPFRRLFGATEFFSALFSFGNLAAHLWGYFAYFRHAKDVFILSGLFKINFVLFCVCWISSTAFHIIDVTLTRDMDYMCGFLSILVNFNFILIRSLYANISRRLIFFICVVFFGCSLLLFLIRFSLLKMGDFNYGMHKKICISVLTATFIGFGIIYLEVRAEGFSKYLLVYVSLITVAGLIEICDLPPLWYLIDSHAIFHFLTMIGVPFFYMFSSEDMNYLFKKKFY